MKIQELFNLQDKVALITGASKGIGEAIARGLAECGARVVVSSRKQDAVDTVAKSFREAGLEAEGMAAHMGRVEDIHLLIKRIEESYGRLDILVNNAAVNPIFGPILDADLGAFDKIMGVNLKGPFELCKTAYPMLEKSGSGAILNISSVGGISPETGLGLYSVSKAALISLTKVLAQEWGPKGIRVNVICPGLIKTKFSKALWQNEEISKPFLKHTPLRRFGVREDIVGLAVFLACDAASYCTGGVYMVDGGVSV